MFFLGNTRRGRPLEGPSRVGIAFRAEKRARKMAERERIWQKVGQWQREATAEHAEGRGEGSHELHELDEWRRGEAHAEAQRAGEDKGARRRRRLARPRARAARDQMVREAGSGAALSTMELASGWSPLGARSVGTSSVPTTIAKFTR